MKEYWCVVQNLKNTKQIEYLLYNVQTPEDAKEEDLIEFVQGQCKENDYRLVVLTFVLLGMAVDQIFPFMSNFETLACIEFILESIEEKSNQSILFKEVCE